VLHPRLSFRIPGGRALRPLLVAAPPPRAIIADTLLTSGSSTTDGSSVSTAVISPVAGWPIYAAFVSAVTGGPNIPAASGNGLVWTVRSTLVLPGNARRLTVFEAIGSAPTTGPVTADFGGQAQTSFAWSIIQCTNADAGPVQIATNLASGATTIVATLAALEHERNLALVFVALANNTAVTPDPNFAERSDDTVANQGAALECETAVNRTICAPTFAAASAGIVAIEVKSAPPVRRTQL